MPLNSHDYDERQTVSLKDLSENGKEKLAGLSDEELQQLKQQAIEAEDYDIAKMIKQEQVERKERVQESNDSQESDWQAHREEAWKKTSEKIQKEKNTSHEENLKKADDLISQLNDGEKSHETEDSQELDWQAQREEARKEVGKKGETNPSDNLSEIKEETKNKLNEISNDEIWVAAETIYRITEWRYRDNTRKQGEIGKFPTKQDIPGMRKYMEEHPENGIIDKASFYTKILKDISDLIKESVNEYEKRGRLIGNTETLETIMKGINIIGDNLEEAGMEDSPQFEKLKSIYKYFSEQKNIIEEYLNLPGPSRRRR